jgi:hypothetical protein
MFSSTYDPKKPLTMTTGVLMVPEETMKAMHAELDRLRGRTMECPTCAERGYDNADYHRLHRAWCDSVAENERLRAALDEAIRQIEYLHKKFRETGSGNAVIAQSREALNREDDASQASSS